jgi:beta-lactam-binding protein with PASTA domain
VPDVTFMTRAEAEAAISRAGFERPPSIDDHSLCGSVVDNRIVELGRVCYQHPPAGREQGARIPISIRVQTENPYGGELGGGRRWFLMPDLVGMHVDKARAKVKELGFVSKEVKLTDSEDPACKPNIVCKTYPERLSRTDTTSDKLFYVGRAPEPPKPPAQPTPPGQPAPPTQPTPPTKPSMGDAF